MNARGWSDGLPLVPPTPRRVLAMLEGTTRSADEVVAVVPPDLVPCTVEKVAINAVMAGCKPEYLPVVLDRGRGGLHRSRSTCTASSRPRWGSAPILIVNGPIRKRSGNEHRDQRTSAKATGRHASDRSRTAARRSQRRAEADRAKCRSRHLRKPRGSWAFVSPKTRRARPGTPLSHELRRPRKEPIRGDRSSPGEGPRGASWTSSRGSRNPWLASLRRLPAQRCIIRRWRPASCDGHAGRSARNTRGSSARRAGPNSKLQFEELDELLLLDSRRGTRARCRDGMAEGIPEEIVRDQTYPEVPDPAGSTSCYLGGGAGLFSAIIGGLGHPARQRQSNHVMQGGAAVSDASTVHPARPDQRTEAWPIRERVPRLDDASEGRHRRPARHQQTAWQHLSRSRCRNGCAERGATVKRYAKPTFTKPAPVDLRHEIAVKCDAVVEALAD